jgi:hypothetical protein
LFVRQAIFNFDGADISERDADVLRLSTGEPPGEMGIAEDPGRGMAKKLLRHPGIRIGILA